MPNFSILLPPSDGKVEGGNPFAPDMFDYRSSNTFNYFHELNADRRHLIDTLHGAMSKKGFDAKALFGADAKPALEINREVYNAPLMSALDRYRPGIMYKAMDFTGLPTGAQRRLLEEGIILSGLFGLLRPDDLIPDYRMPMLSSFDPFGAVDAYWKPRITPVLNRTIAGRLVWNMLPEAFDHTWDNEITYASMVRVCFHRMTDGEMKPVTEGLQPLRGRLVNFIVRETLEELEPLLLWRHPDGYVYDEHRSSYDEESRTHQIVMVRH